MSARDPIDELSQQLFAAARAEQPRSALRAQTEEAVARALLQTPPTAASVRPRGRRMVVAWGACAALGVAALVLLTLLPAPTRNVLSISPEKLEHRAAPPRPAVAPSEHASTPEPTPTQKPAATSQQRPTARGASANAGAGANTSPRRASPPPSLAEEIAALDRARKALTGTDANAALQALNDYDANLHGTQLRAEATLLRIEALSKLGRSTEAKRLADDFENTFPGSPLADRVRALTTTQPNGGTP